MICAPRALTSTLRRHAPAFVVRSPIDVVIASRSAFNISVVFATCVDNFAFNYFLMRRQDRCCDMLTVFHMDAGAPLNEMSSDRLIK